MTPVSRILAGLGMTVQPTRWMGAGECLASKLYSLGRRRQPTTFDGLKGSRRSHLTGAPDFPLFREGLRSVQRDRLRVRKRNVRPAIRVVFTLMRSAALSRTFRVGYASIDPDLPGAASRRSTDRSANESFSAASCETEPRSTISLVPVASVT